MQHYISDADFGRACQIPELAKLDSRTQGFVWEWTHNGCDPKKASIAAGYHEQVGYALLKRQNVIDAITALTDRMMHGGAIPAINAVLEIVNNPTHKDRLKAAGMILNRTGWPEVQEHRVRVEKVPDEAAMISAAIELSKKMGVDPAMLLGRNTALIEATPLHVLPEPLPDGSDI